ncbi:MAG: imidazole glycerol phosphate synthase subunit HisH [Ferruginibacter sp.]
MSSNKQNIVVIDYGMGNIGSVCNMFKHIGVSVTVSSDMKTIANAEKLVLPGVGHFDRAMDNINSLGIFNLIRDKSIIHKTPILGICLGMQIMCESSEEGSLPGLSLIKGEIRKFKFADELKLKIPHMGWDTIEINKKSDILCNLDNNSRFYFVHSYFVSCENSSDILTYTNYGDKFVSSFQVENIIGVQFHPEKSHKFGMNLFKNFIEL